MSLGINHSDRKVRDAIDTVTEELEAQEAKINGLEQELKVANAMIEDQGDTIEAQAELIADLEKEIEKLQKDLAESILVHQRKENEEPATVTTTTTVHQPS